MNNYLMQCLHICEEIKKIREIAHTTAEYTVLDQRIAESNPLWERYVDCGGSALEGFVAHMHHLGYDPSRYGEEIENLINEHIKQR